MVFANQKGNVIAYIVIAMTTIAALAVGALYMTSSSALGELGANTLDRAYFLALAGKDYALINNLGDTSGRIFTLQNQSGQILPSNDKFQLDITGNIITSTGIINAGTPFETRRQIRITKTGFSSRPDINFAKDIQSFASPIQSQAGFITTDTTIGQVSLGKTGMGNSSGALWYAGSGVQGNCPNGICDFGTGFRAFFVFQFAAGSTGDGFTFAIFNGANNDLYSVGGHYGLGELLAYAGSSFISVGRYLDNNRGNGIQPPKMAIEFDIYSNSGCPSGAPCSSNSRCDSSDGRDHMAYVFWGDNTRMCSGFGTTVGQETYDDNQHGAGSDGVDEPQNALTTDPNSYFEGGSWGPDWLKSATVYALRIEVSRSKNPNATDNYYYTVETWVKQCLDNNMTCSTFDDQSNYANTKIIYNNVVPGDNPTLIRTFELSPTYHINFNSFLFGWTAATGGATQNVMLNRFRMNFAQGCGSYGVWNNLGNIAYFSINGVGCTPINNNNLISNIFPSGFINGFTDAACTISSSPSSINYTQATADDTNKDCVVNFNGTDR